MAVHLIPLEPSVAEYTMEVTLETSHYLMHVYWNDRDQAFYFDMFASDSTPILLGIKIVLGVYLGRVARVAPFTSGVFIVLDTSGQKQDAGFDDLGSRVQMYYIPVLDLLINTAKAVAKLQVV